VGGPIGARARNSHAALQLRRRPFRAFPRSLVVRVPDRLGGPRGRSRTDGRDLLASGQGRGVGPGRCAEPRDKTAFRPLGSDETTGGATTSDGYLFSPFFLFLGET